MSCRTYTYSRSACTVSGAAVTVTVVVVEQPGPAMYVITEVPPVVATPVTVVVPEGPVITVATDVVALVHEPPPVASLKVAVEPGHIVTGPPLIAGRTQVINSSAPMSGVTVLRVWISISVVIAIGVVMGVPAAREPTAVKCRSVGLVHIGVGS